MRILVLGAYGLIGWPTVQLLISAGHTIVGVGRGTSSAARRLPHATWINQDVAKLRQPSDWVGLLAGVEAIVNAAGTLQDGLRDDVEALQSQAMQALWAACGEAGIRRVVQISALGASGDSPTAFMRSKARADAALAATELDWTILRPGVVLGPQAYGGSALLRALAAAPFIVPVVGGEQSVRLVYVDDVARAVLLAVEGRIPARQRYDLVEPEARPIQETLLALRAWLGFPKARVWPVPRFAVLPVFWLGDVAGWLGWRPAARTTLLRELERGVEGDPAPFAAVAGPLAGLEDMLRRLPSTVQERWYARLWSLKPVIILTLSMFWVGTGVIALIRLNQESMALLTDRGFSASAARLWVIAGALADIAVGAGILARPLLKPAAWGMIAVSLIYAVLGTFIAPELWLDPLGPFMKVLLCLALVAVLLAVAESR
jgi:uncharacterized protein YbjT (DUF2867 family)